MEPEMAVDARAEVGEGPLWHPMEERLYWIDIAACSIFRYDPASGRNERIYRDTAVGGFTIQADGALLLFAERGAVKSWRNGVLTTVIQEIPAERDTRFNDVIADPAGRVFCGTMPSASHPGALYRLDPDGRLTVVLEGLGISNGMGFTPDGAGMYHTDSSRGEIKLFDYDRATGGLSNPRVFLRVPDSEGEPDGMTVDAEGYVWSARWNGGCLVRYTPEGQEALRVHFPARKVSCPTFGGGEYRDIYVTTAGGQNRAEEGAGAGALFRLRAGVQGVQENLSRVGLE